MRVRNQEDLGAEFGMYAPLQFIAQSNVKWYAAATVRPLYYSVWLIQKH